MELPSALLMFISFRHAEERIVEHLRAHGFADLTLAQGRLAARVAEGGSRVTELAEAAQVTKQTAGFLVNQLEKGGYVERVPDPSDARARLVCGASRKPFIQGIQGDFDLAGAPLAKDAQAHFRARRKAASA